MLVSQQLRLVCDAPLAPPPKPRDCCNLEPLHRTRHAARPRHGHLPVDTSSPAIHERRISQAKLIKQSRLVHVQLVLCKRVSIHYHGCARTTSPEPEANAGRPHDQLSSTLQIPQLQSNYLYTLLDVFGDHCVPHGWLRSCCYAGFCRAACWLASVCAGAFGCGVSLWPLTSVLVCSGACLFTFILVPPCWMAKTLCTLAISVRRATILEDLRTCLHATTTVASMPTLT